MSENEQKPVFFGTYFNKDGVITLSRWAAIAAWVALGAYALDWLSYMLIFITQFSAGMFVEKGGGFLFSLTNLIMPLIQRPLPGIGYFFALMGISRLMLIFLDIEDNTRRSARAGK